MTDQRPADQRPLGWGIVGTGGIASSFATDLALAPGAALVAVGSRSQDSADEFAARFGGVRAHPSYARLVADPDVDCVYVSTPHPFHHAAARLAIEAGKAVLVEKPFTLNAREAEDLVALARERDTFLMEGMWTRFLPHFVRVREVLGSGLLGDVRTVLVDHSQWFATDPGHRLFAPDLGGGALLDLGVYPLSFASMVLGPPTRITAVSDPAVTGVDAQTSVLLQHEGGRHAVVSTTLSAVGPTRAAVVGTEARLEIASKWYAPSPFTVTSRAGEVLETFTPEPERKGLWHEVAEVVRCVRAGRTESPVMPLDESVALMRTMDEIRRQIGVVYPGE